MTILRVVLELFKDSKNDDLFVRLKNSKIKRKTTELKNVEQKSVFIFTKLFESLCRTFQSFIRLRKI